jgi:hypothetical protein
MGLDHTIYRKKKGEEAIEVASFRKAYVIDNWFGVVVSEGWNISNCVPYDIDIDDIYFLSECLIRWIRNKKIDEKFIIEGWPEQGYDSCEYKLKDALVQLSNIIRDHEEGDEYIYEIWY